MQLIDKEKRNQKMKYEIRCSILKVRDWINFYRIQITLTTYLKDSVIASFDNLNKQILGKRPAT